MSEINPQSTIVNGVWIQQTYDGQIESGRGGGVSLTRNYILRKKGNNALNKTQEMDQETAYACFQSFILRFQQHILYQTNEGTIPLWTSKLNVNVDRNNYPVYKGEATWVWDPRKPNYLIQPTTWSHRMVGGTRKASVPMLPQRNYTRPGVQPILHKGVNWNRDKHIYDGVDIYSPEWRIVAKQQLLSSVTTMNYWKSIMSLSKTVNMEPFLTFPPGTVLYLGVDADESFVNENRVFDISSESLDDILRLGTLHLTSAGLQCSREGNDFSGKNVRLAASGEQ